MKKALIFLFVLFTLACQQQVVETVEVKEAPKTLDPHSYSQPNKAIVKHLDLDINVDFLTKVITGKASWVIENSTKDNEIIFDTRQLQIQRITLGDDEMETTFSQGAEKEFLGKPLIIKIDSNTTKVNIYYTTAPEAGALQWLTPQQTAGKVHPFLFTQSQAILARTWIPCQDSPGIRFTYSAKVSVPKELLALMSAENPQQRNETGLYQFTQTKAIPSYLMALAVGDLSFKATDNRTGVYAEPVTLEKAAYEFADMGKMVTSAEKLYGPYQWGRFDVLVLPPSFPFGGMENPMLTFATPTVIAGDRSLVSLIAHELAHSWSGNLVTNATWNDFWLNEGFTVYIERRILEDIYGKDEAQMQEVLGFESLTETLDDMGLTNPDTRLKADFTGRDPDLGVTEIAYEKGYSFLKSIENAVGRVKMDDFLKKYFTSHAFQSVTTEQFLAYLQANLLANNSTIKDSINTNSWVYEAGLPTKVPAIGSEKFQEIDSILINWKTTKITTGISPKLKSTNELLYFIGHLPKSLSLSEMESLDKEFRLTQSGNAEIQAAWYTVAIRNKYQAAYSKIEQFLINVGRRKFLTPLYKEMIKTQDGKVWAKKIYAQARPNYHSVAYNTIDELVK